MPSVTGRKYHVPLVAKSFMAALAACRVRVSFERRQERTAPVDGQPACLAKV